MNRAQYKRMSSIVRKISGPPRLDASTIGSRARLFVALSQHVENGRVVIGRYGRDCDGQTFDFGYEYKATPRAIEREVDEIEHWADGPISFYFQTPSAYNAERSDHE
jgi:hypothetical protein